MAKMRKTIDNKFWQKGKKEPSFTVGGVANWCNQWGNQFGEFPKS